MKQLIAALLLIPTLHCGSDNGDARSDAPPPRDTTGDHGYFDMLAAHPNAHYSLAGRSNDEIWPLRWSNPSNYQEDELYYDSAIDAAANRFNEGDGSSGTGWGPGRDGRNQFPAISEGTIFYYWEARWSDRFTSKDENNRIGGDLETHKAFILYGNLNDDRAVEIRSRFNAVSGDVGVAETDIRQYGAAAGISPAGDTDGGDSIGVRSQPNFVVQANAWTYHWVFVDLSNGKLSYWIQDENQALALVYDDIDIVVESTLELVGFEFRHNSSQSGGTAPDGTIWNRNLAVLTGLNLSEAQALVDVR